jgi:peptidoglycan/xylan/chitin deacetylase (PgdA/CDA1 family)
VSDEGLTTVVVDAGRLPRRVAWADGLTVRVPAWLATRVREGSPFEDQADPVAVGAAADDLRTRAAYTNRPPASARLPVNYRRVPAPVRHAVARTMGRIQRARQSTWSRFPGWPIDLSADFTADLAGGGWTAFARTPVLLTHDIDSPEGLRNLVRLFLPLEERDGARSANYVVPCDWPVDHGLLGEIVQRGHEVGVHGYDHANRTPFAESSERRQRLAAGRAFGDRYQSAGYRAPSLLRTAPLLADLGSLYRYDSSIPTSGGAFPVPNNGCASARPWRLGQLWELPLTLPRDGSLRFLGHGPAAIGRLWAESARLAAKSGGIVCLLTHCEAGFSGNDAMLEVYRCFLEWVAGEPGFEFIRPIDLVARLEGARGVPRATGG